jgi:SAM-dependent methyltransferase
VDRDEWDARYAGDELLWHAEPNRFLVPEVEGLAPGRALDLACGEGRNGVWLAGRGWDVTGVDFSAVALAKARRLAADRGVEAEWIEADVLEWEPPSEAFDLIVVMYLQLPADQLGPVLGRLPGALRPGGTLLVVGHDLDNLAHGHGGPKDPAVLLTAESVVASLPGLDVARAGQVRRPTDEGDAIDTLVRATRPRGR